MKSGGLASRVGIVKELLHFFWKSKLWWLIPFVYVLICISLLLIFAQSVPILPFLYTAF